MTSVTTLKANVHLNYMIIKNYLIKEMDGKYMLTVTNLSKQLKEKSILQSISFEVKAGECVALIGPNGAGKTTLISCILGDRRLSTGSVLLNGQLPKAKANKRKLAVLLQENVLPKGLTAMELIHFFQTIHQDSLTMEEIQEMLQFSTNQLQQLTEKLSGGQKRLLAFVLCLIGKPSILFLDEPTAGMDTSTRQRFWQIIQELKSEGKTIFYTSHYIEEVEHTADRILLLHQGKLIQDTTPYAIRNAHMNKLVTLPIRFLSVVQSLESISHVVKSVETVQFETKQLDYVWQQLQQAGCRITDVEIQNQSLLNILFAMTEEEKE